MTIRQIVGPRLPYFGVALFAGLTRGPIMADLLHLYAAFTYHLEPKQVGYLATGAALISWPIGFAAFRRTSSRRRKYPACSGSMPAVCIMSIRR